MLSIFSKHCHLLSVLSNFFRILEIKLNISLQFNLTDKYILVGTERF